MPKMSLPSFSQILVETKKFVEPRLHAFVRQATTHGRLSDALLHSTRGSGKYIRPHLTLTFAQSTSQTAIDLGCAIELVHCYSLIHDDLPCMDNADLRRGLPSVWKAFDEATAVLAGDALIPLAYDILAKLTLPADTKIELIAEFSQAIGGNGLVGGQMMDLFPSKNLNDIEQMQLLKTGALLSFSCLAGAILAHGVKSPQVRIAQDFGAKLGLIYQITDDLLSVRGTSEQTGKPVQNDDDKITFVSVFGVEGAQQLLLDLSADLAVLSQQTQVDHQLQPILDFVLHRSY